MPYRRSRRVYRRKSSRKGVAGLPVSASVLRQLNPECVAQLVDGKIDRIRKMLSKKRERALVSGNLVALEAAQAVKDKTEANLAEMRGVMMSKAFAAAKFFDQARPAKLDTASMVGLANAGASTMGGLGFQTLNIADYQGINAAAFANL